MVHITKEEIIKIARMSNIAIHEDELDGMVQKLQAVLTYAARVQEVAVEVDEPERTLINIVRTDTVIPTDPQPLLAQAPEREEQFFVVPKVLGSNS